MPSKPDKSPQPARTPIATINSTWAWAAGEVISTTRDLDRFITALLGGDLLRPDLLAQMRDTLPLGGGTGCGLGLLSLDLGPECGGVYEGHDGGLPGYLSLLLSTGDGTRRLELSVTISDVNPDDPQAAQRFFTAFNTLVTTAACGSPRPVANTALLNLAASSRSYPTAIDHPVVS